MRQIITGLLILAVLSFISCVQKTFKKTVVFTLDVSEIKNCKSVGIRGNDQPLSWDKDLKMKEIKKDSLFEITVSGETAFQFTEVKFVVNGVFELQNNNNRRIYFDKEKDTTYYKAKFNRN